MFNILLILIFTGGIVVAAIFAGVTFLQGVRSAQEVQITKQRLIETAARIQSQARYINGYIALPQGASGSSPYAYNQVPTWISSHARSASGVPFLYCPYAISDVSGTSTNITMPSGSTYSIKYTSNASTISQNYVTGGSTAPAGAPTGTIGLLIAPSPQSNQPPNCSSISASADGTPVVTGGLVVPIQDNFLNKMKMATTPTDLRIYINSAASGDGSGRDTNNYATITTAMNMLAYVKPAQVTLYFNSAATFPSSFSWGGRVHLEAASTATVVRISGLVIDEFSMVSARNITLRTDGGVTINGELQLDSATLTTNLSAPTGANVYGGVLSSIGNNTINGDITVDGGGMVYNGGGSSLTFESLTNRGFRIISGGYASDGGSTFLRTSTSNITMGYVGSGGTLQTMGVFHLNSSAAVSVKGGLVVDPGGRMTTDNSGSYYNFYRMNDYMIYAHGGVETNAAGYLRAQSADGSGLTYGVVLASGGYLIDSQHASASFITAASFADRPSTAVYDNGGSRFIMNFNGTSASFIFARTDCWHGRSGTNLFSDTANAGTTTGHVSYTAQSAGYRWLRLYNQSYSSCTIL